MIKKTFMRILLSSLFLVIMFGVVSLYADSMSTQTVAIQTQSEMTHVFRVEIADEPHEQSKGLMNREVLEEDAGMLFISPYEQMQSFWMKNTLIPLDMIFVARDGRILKIHHNAVPHDVTPISSGIPAKGVLEINAGLAYKLGIQVGDRLLHKEFLAD